jgi:hypothetical protein
MKAISIYSHNNFILILDDIRKKKPIIIIARVASIMPEDSEMVRMMTPSAVQVEVGKKIGRKDERQTP